MKDAYVDAFYDVVKHTQTKHGYELPHHVEAYIVMLMTDFVDRDDVPPDASFAEMFLSLRDKQQAKQLGDTCLFVSGAFPKYKAKYGINRKYYQDIGSTSYEMASDIERTTISCACQTFCIPKRIYRIYCTFFQRCAEYPFPLVSPPWLSISTPS